MPTSPRLLPGEAPLTPGLVDQFLSAMDSDMVLVGGQALAFWMDRYGLRPKGAAISNDGDVLGPVARAHDMAVRLKAELVKPRQSDRTALVAQVRVQLPAGGDANIDVLHMLYTVNGLRKSAEFTKRVIADSVEVEWRAGKFIRVMDPFNLLDSRVQNAVGLLEEKGPHVLTQVRWAIEVARAALIRLASGTDSLNHRLGQKLQAIFTLANSRAGRSLLREHDIEVLDAIDVDALRSACSGHDQQLAKLEEAKVRRHQARTPAPADVPRG